MSSLRQGSIIVVADQDFHRIEAPFKEAFFTHTSTSPNLQIIASIDLARRQMELEGYELVNRAIQLAIEVAPGDQQPSADLEVLQGRDTRGDDPQASIDRPATATTGRPVTFKDGLQALDEDEFFLDPTRITLLCGRAGFDGSQFKALLASEYDIQINKTSRNSVLVQININNTRSDLAHLIKVLADISRGIERRLSEGSDVERQVLVGAGQGTRRGRAGSAGLQLVP